MSQRILRGTHVALFAVSIVSLIAATATPAADSNKGRALHQQHCTACHEDSVYKRPNRRVQSKAALQAQITGCEHAANAKLSENQINDLVNYLNQTYYQFK